MIRSQLFGLLTATILGVATVSTATAQSALPFPVTCSGCPNAVLLTGQGFTNQQAQINTTISITATWPTSAGSAATLLAIGYSTGNCTQDWSSFLTFCSGGPCNWYLAPFGSTYDLIVASGDSVTMSLPIPNDRSLVFNVGTFAVQGLHIDGTTACLDMSKAYSIALSL